MKTCLTLFFPIVLAAVVFSASSVHATTGVNVTNAIGKDALVEITLPDHLGKTRSLAAFDDQKLLVVAFLGVECPLAKLYAGRLQTLADDYADQGVAFVAIDSNQQDSLTEIASYVRKHEIKYPVLKDQGNQAADLFGAERTPQVFLLDGNRKIQYQGRIDDQYVVGVVRDAPSREDLRLAIDQTLANKPVQQPSTTAIGCIIGRVREANADSPVNYVEHIAPILSARCVECHRAGEIGPFELTGFDKASGWGEMIAEVVREQRMPPWHANPAHGRFANDRSMTETEKELICQWVENGCPSGDLSKVAASREFTSGWQMPREPDQVFAMSEPFTVPADVGPEGVPYQYFKVPTNFSEDKWVTAAEVQPGNRQVLHHTIVYAVPPESKRRRNWIFLAAYVPGLRFDALPEKSAKRIPAGSTLVFEQHYTPIGSEQQDVTQLGLLFADVDKIEREVVTTEVGNTGFAIPPNESAHVVTATSRPVKGPATLLSMSPHMHLRGKAFRYELVLANGEREILLDVPAYDFNWQTRYLLEQPRELPAGSMIHCRAAFDNSEQNLANPDPSKTVRWGDQSWDEMMLGYFDIIVPRDDSQPAGKKPIETGFDIVGQFDVADEDGDGSLTKVESAANELVKKHFDQIDSSQDDRLQLGEILTAVLLRMSQK